MHSRVGVDGGLGPGLGCQGANLSGAGDERKGFPAVLTRRTVTSMRVRRTLAVAAAILTSVAWGASASAAPQPQQAPAHHPIVVTHLMSSCGGMDDAF